MAFPPSDKSMEGVIRDTRDRLDLVERRLAFGGGGGDTEPATIHVAGEVWQVPSGVAPPDTLLCDGRAVSRTTYAELFAKIGTTYGNGDGSTTFNLPMLNGKQTIVNGAQGVIDGIFPPLGNSAQYADSWDIFYALDNSAAGAANCELRMQFRAGGVNLNAASYSFARDGMSTGNLQALGTGQTYVEPAWGTMTTAWGRIRVNRAGHSGRWTDFESVAGMRSPSLSSEVMHMAGSYQASTVVNGIALYAAAGTLTGWIEAIPVGGSLVPSVIATKDITSGLVGTGTTSGGAAGAALPAGAVVAWDSNTVPTGFLLCDGTITSRAAYPALFAAIGTTHGAGDGSTTFALPDYRGRTLVGRDPAQTEFDVLGETGGAKTHTLTVAEMPPHSHTIKADISPYPGGVSQSFHLGTNNPSHPSGFGTESSGSGGAHNNLQPYAVANWIISTGAGSNPVTPVVPVHLWQEFTLDPAGALLQPVNGGAAVWNGPVSGNLGATLDGTKTTITLPSAGTYRIITHLGYGGNSTASVSGALYIGGVAYAPSNIYGVANPSAVFNADVEVTITVAGPTAFTQGMVAPNGVYRWSWLRIEKIEPFYAKDALTVQQGSTALRDSIYGIPTTDATKASLANRMISWFNTDKGWYEVYYATTGTAGLTAQGLLAGYPSGWYPTTPGVIFGHRGKTDGFQTITATPIEITLAAAQELKGGVLSTGVGGMTVPIGGRYRLSINHYATGNVVNHHGGQLKVGSTVLAAVTIPKTTGSDGSGMAVVSRPVAAGTVVSQWGYAAAASSAYGSDGYTGSFFEVEYMGPPLVNG